MTTLMGARLLVAGADLSGDANAVSLEYGAGSLVANVLGEDVRHVGGLPSVSVGYRGFWEAGSTRIDATAFAEIGQDCPLSVCPQGSTVGALAYTLQTVHTQYAQGGQVGELRSVTLEAEGDGALYRGAVLANTTAQVASTDATPVQLGGSSGKRAGASVHVLDSTGCGDEALTVTLQSANTSGFAAPSTRITLPTAYESTGVFGTAIGTTDAWWRAGATVTGSTAVLYPVSTTAGLWTGVATSSDTGYLFAATSGVFGFDSTAGLTALSSGGLVVEFTSAANADPSFGYVVAAGIG